MSVCFRFVGLICVVHLWSERHESLRRWDVSGCPSPWWPCAVWRWCAFGKRKPHFSRRVWEGYRIAIPWKSLATMFRMLVLKRTTTIFLPIKVYYHPSQKGSTILKWWLTCRAVFSNKMPGKSGKYMKSVKMYIFPYIFCSKTLRISYHTHHIIPQKFTHHT